VSTAHIWRPTDIIREYNLRTDVKYKHKEKFFLVIIKPNQIHILQ